MQGGGGQFGAKFEVRDRHLGGGVVGPERHILHFRPNLYCKIHPKRAGNRRSGRQDFGLSFIENASQRVNAATRRGAVLGFKKGFPEFVFFVVFALGPTPPPKGDSLSAGRTSGRVDQVAFSTFGQHVWPRNRPKPI